MSRLPNLDWVSIMKHTGSGGVSGRPGRSNPSLSLGLERVKAQSKLVKNLELLPD